MKKKMQFAAGQRYLYREDDNKIILEIRGTEYDYYVTAKVLQILKGKDYKKTIDSFYSSCGRWTYLVGQDKPKPVRAKKSKSV